MGERLPAEQALQRRLLATKRLKFHVDLVPERIGVMTRARGRCFQVRYLKQVVDIGWNMHR